MKISGTGSAIPKKIVTNEMLAEFLDTSDEWIRTRTGDLNEDELKKDIPLNRFGEAEEIAELVGFLASEKAGYITGECISINGGLYM